MFSSTSPSFLSILEYLFIKTQILLILPILPTHISLNVKDDGVAVGTNKHAKPEGPEKEIEEPGQMRGNII